MADAVEWAVRIGVMFLAGSGTAAWISAYRKKRGR